VTGNSLEHVRLSKTEFSLKIIVKLSVDNYYFAEIVYTSLTSFGQLLVRPPPVPPLIGYESCSRRMKGVVRNVRTPSRRMTPLPSRRSPHLVLSDASSSRSSRRQWSVGGWAGGVADVGRPVVHPN